MQVNQELLNKLESKLKVSRRRVYDLISKKVNETKLPRHLAAIDLASECGIGIAKYASREELDEIRLSSQTKSTMAPAPNSAPIGKGIATSGRGKSKSFTKKTRKGNIVFVVHGRNEKLRKSLFSFLRAIHLNPIEWSKAIELTKKPSPYVGEILDAAFEKATAVVVLLTPDDEAQLRKAFLKKTDPPFESELTGQPRPNVLFEAGMAFGTHPDNTVLVQIGNIRPISDVIGRHVVHLSGSIESRKELITKLKNCECIVDDSGSDWLEEGTFESVE
jgi:predicted nucleotide-binding protein